MANPTSNFNWQMPTNTDLVKDLPADFEVFGQAVDTSLADLKGGTSGQILSKNSNTDMDFVWINNDQGDITAVNVTSPITGGGSAGAVTVGIQDGTTAQKGAVQLENSTSSTSTTTAAVPASVKSAYDLANAAIPKSLIDAEGDLIVGDANDAVQRLAIGTTGQVLTVDTTIDGKIKWATAASGGGFTLIQDQQASSSSAINFTSIAGTYKHLLLTWEGLRSTTDSSTAYDVRFNADSSSVYHSRGISYIGTTGTVQAASNTSAGFGKLIGQGFQGAGVNEQSRGYLWIYDYASTTRFKVCVGSSSYMDQGLGETNLPMVLTNYASTSAITSVDITRIAGSGNLTNATSTSIRLYGVS
jgi:hypothetical protein